MSRLQRQRRRPEETTLYEVVQEQLETLLGQVEAKTGTGLSPVALPSGLILEVTTLLQRA